MRGGSGTEQAVSDEFFSVAVSRQSAATVIERSLRRSPETPLRSPYSPTEAFASRSAIHFAIAVLLGEKVISSRR